MSSLIQDLPTKPGKKYITPNQTLDDSEANLEFNQKPSPMTSSPNLADLAFFADESPVKARLKPSLAPQRTTSRLSFSDDNMLVNEDEEVIDKGRAIFHTMRSVSPSMMKGTDMTIVTPTKTKPTEIGIVASAKQALQNQINSGRSSPSPRFRGNANIDSSENNSNNNDNEDDEEVIGRGRSMFHTIRSVSPSMPKGADLTIVAPMKTKPAESEVGLVGSARQVFKRQSSSDRSSSTNRRAKTSGSEDGDDLDAPLQPTSTRSKDSDSRGTSQEFSGAIYDHYPDEDEQVIDKGRSIRSVSPSMVKGTDIPVMAPTRKKPTENSVTDMARQLLQRPFSSDRSSSTNRRAKTRGSEDGDDLDAPLQPTSTRSKDSDSRRTSQEFSGAIYDHYPDEDEQVIDKGRSLRSVSPSMVKGTDLPVMAPTRKKPTESEVGLGIVGSARQVFQRQMSSDSSSTSNTTRHAKIVDMDGSELDESLFSSRSRPMDSGGGLDSHLDDSRKREKPQPVNPRVKAGQLTPEMALQVMLKERSDMEMEKARLRSENADLKDALSSRPTPQVPNLDPNPQGNVEIIEKIVEVVVEDPNADRWKSKAEKLQQQNMELKVKNQVDSRKLLQSVLAHECISHPFSAKNNPNEHQKIQDSFRDRLVKDFQLDQPIEYPAGIGDNMSDVTFDSHTPDKGPPQKTVISLTTTEKPPVRVMKKSEAESEIPKVESKSKTKKDFAKIYDEKGEPDGDEDDDDDDQLSEYDGEDLDDDDDDVLMARMNSARSNSPSIPAKTKQGKLLPTLSLPTAKGAGQSGTNKKGASVSKRGYIEEKDDEMLMTSGRNRPASLHDAKKYSTKVPPIMPYKHPSLPILLWEGGGLWKIPFNGKGPAERRTIAVKRASMPGPHARPVRILAKGETADDGAAAVPVAYIAFPPTLIWFNPINPSERKNARELILEDGAYAVAGSNTPAFWKYLSRNEGAVPRASVCFSVVTSIRTLDLAADSEREVNEWKSATIALLSLLSSTKGWSGEQIMRDKPSWNLEDDGLNSARKYPLIAAGPASKQGPLSARTGSANRQSEPNSSRSAAPAPLTSRSLNANESIKRQMFTAAMTGDAETFTEIVETGLSVNLIDPVSTDTPMMIACRANKPEIVKICLRFGARNDPHPDFGQTALHAAAACRSYDCALELLAAAAPSGADVLISNLTDPRGQSPLHVACSMGDSDLIQLFMKHGADIARGDCNGQSSLHMCAAAGHKSCLALLLDHGGDMMIDQRDTTGNTALHCAAREGNLTCVKLLLETAADGNARNNAGQTAYTLASSRGHQQISLLLLDYLEPMTARMTARSQLPSGRSPKPPRPGMYSNPHTFASTSASHGNDPTMPPRSGRASSENTATLPRPHTMSPMRRNSYSGINLHQLNGPPSPGYRVVKQAHGLDVQQQHSKTLPNIFQGLEVHPLTARGGVLHYAPAYGYEHGYEQGYEHSNHHHHQQQQQQHQTYGSGSAFGEYDGYHFPENNPHYGTGQGGYDYNYDYDYSHDYQQPHTHQHVHPGSPTRLNYASAGAGLPSAAPPSLSPMKVMELSYGMARGARIPHTTDTAAAYHHSYSHNYEATTEHPNVGNYENYTSHDYSGQGQYGHEVHQGHGTDYTDAMYDASYAYNEHQHTSQDEDAEVADNSQPVEQFTWGYVDWQVYVTDEGHTYYLDAASGHSQWDDPREHGLSSEYVGEGSYREVPGEDSGDGSGDGNYHDDEHKHPQEHDHQIHPLPPKTPPKTSPPKQANNTQRTESVPGLRPTTSSGLPNPVTQKFFSGGPRQKYDTVPDPEEVYDLNLGPSFDDIGRVKRKKKKPVSPVKSNTDTDAVGSVTRDPSGNKRSSQRESSRNLTASSESKSNGQRSSQSSTNGSVSNSNSRTVQFDAQGLNPTQKSITLDTETRHAPGDFDLEASGDYFSPKETGSLDVSADDMADFHELPDAAAISKALEPLSEADEGNSSNKTISSGRGEECGQEKKGLRASTPLNTVPPLLGSPNDNDARVGAVGGGGGGRGGSESLYRPPIFDPDRQGPTNVAGSGLGLNVGNSGIHFSTQETQGSMHHASGGVSASAATSDPGTVTTASANHSTAHAIGQKPDPDSLFRPPIYDPENLWTHEKDKNAASQDHGKVLRECMSEATLKSAQDNRSNTLLTSKSSAELKTVIAPSRDSSPAPFKEALSQKFAKANGGEVESEADVQAKVQKYSDMLQRGIALKTVKERMERDNESKEVMKKVLEVSSKSSTSKKSSDPADSSSTAVATTSITSTTANLKSSTEDDSKEREAKLKLKMEKYLGMLKNGNSIRIVRREMEAAGESSDIIMCVVRAADDIVVEPTVKEQTIVDGGKEKSTSKAASAAPVVKEDISVLKQDAVLGKYARMASVGVPPSNIAQRMKLDNVNSKDMNRLLRALGEAVDEPEESEPGPEAGLENGGGKSVAEQVANVMKPTTKETLENLLQDATISKYARMISVGVPSSNVIHRMQLDKISTTNISRLLRAIGEEGPGGGVEAAPDGIPRPSTGPAGKARPPLSADGKRPSTSAGKSSLQKIHWDTLPAEKLRKSVWMAADDDENHQEHDLDELEELFGARENTRPRSDSRNQKPSSAVTLLVLEANRAQNIVIGLAQFRSFESHANLLRTVCSFDKNNGVLDAEKVENLRALLPTTTEISRVKDQKEKINHPAELFIKTATDFFPELPLRIDMILSCEHFEHECDTTLQKVNTLIDACNQVISSDKLARILQKMLAVGNIMNQGTHRGQAEGITLDSMMKMVHMKGVDKKTSVLDYVVKKILSKGDEKILTATDDISLSEEASRLSGQELAKFLQSHTQTFGSIEQEIHRARGCKISSTGVTSEITDMYVSELEAFLVTSQPKAQELTRVRNLMNRKVTEVVEYFGEDIATCDTVKIFGVLSEFRRAIISSKTNVMKKLKSSS